MSTGTCSEYLLLVIRLVIFEGLVTSELAALVRYPVLLEEMGS
jgi:hypothetical protein